MKDLMEQLSMNKDKESPDHESGELEAKMEVLKQLHQMASDLLGGDLDSMDEAPEIMEEMPEDMEQVSVMAEDEEGLEEGLDVAKKLMKKKESTGDFY